MDISTTSMTSAFQGAEKSNLNMQVEAFNASLNGKRTNEGMGKDDFLQILITQLRHQDPTKPMEDKEFIAQMAQFSSLEQMTNMSEQFSKLSDTLKSSQAISMVGRFVELAHGEDIVSGFVQGATSGSFPQILVNGSYYDFDKINKVMDKGESSK